MYIIKKCIAKFVITFREKNTINNHVSKGTAYEFFKNLH